MIFQSIHPHRVHWNRSGVWKGMPRSHGAFTLIELLIVVAIISLLAAIAVPNYLAAQTRARVAAVRGELRTLANSLELYRVDEGFYPPENAPFQPYRVPNMLTTPIAYLSGIPLDRFRRPGTEDPMIREDVWRRYVYQNFQDRHRSQGQCGSGGGDRCGGLANYGAWVLSSVGPNRFYNGVVEYDPSNGTISTGDIIRSARNPEIQGEYRY